MDSLKEIVSKYNFNIRKYEEKNNIKIIDTDKGKFVLKKKDKDDNNLYKYLLDKNFDFLLDREEINDYDIFPYIEEKEVLKEDKAIDLVYILSLLHNKTSFYRDVVLDDVKNKYEELNKKIDNLNKYYFDMQDVIEQKIYMSPEEYLLIRNVSMIYSALTFSKQKLKEWFDYKKTQKKERIVLLHNKVSLDHLLISDKKSLISWNNYTRDIPIYDFLNFYRNNYNDVEMMSLFDMYQSKFYYTKDEYLLFLALVSIPEKIVFTKHHFNDCKRLYMMIDYLLKTRDFVLKNNKEYKAEDEEEFQEQ